MKYILFIVLIFFFLFYPSSKNGIIDKDIVAIIYPWVILCIVLIISLFYFGCLDNKNATIAFCVFIYLIIVSLISTIADTNSQLSLARIVPYCTFLLLSSINFNIKIPENKLFIFFDIIIIIIFSVNISLINQVESIELFIINNYSQLYEDATFNMLLKNRPIFTFGVYTFASYFYCLFFLLSYHIYYATKKIKYQLYCIILLIINILLISNFAIVSSIFMLFLLIKISISGGLNFKLLFLLTIFVLISFWIINNRDLLENYFVSILSDKNGVKGRYSNNGVFGVNDLYLNNYPNVGFNIIRNLNLTYTDSGYLVVRLMGGWILIIPHYYLLYNFFKNNFKKKYLLFFLITILFEFALPVTLYLKFLFAIVFCIIYMTSLKSYKLENS